MRGVLLVAFNPFALGAIPIATFDGSKGTTLAWQTVNDPVMGGKSHSVFSVDAARAVGVWTGAVEIVPFLKAPGFCNLQSPGLGKTAKFPDVSSASGINIRAREANSSDLIHFGVMLNTKGARRLFRQGTYMANVSLSSNMTDHVVPWSAFRCTWRGEPVTWCPDIATQLSKITSIGLGTAFPGKAGPFNIELAEISGHVSEGGHRAASGSAGYVDLASFDGSAPHKWHSENDPVMGGRSTSSVAVKQSFADYQGSTRIVPSLKAPGFTIALTEGLPAYSAFPDVSTMDGLTVSVRNVGGSYSGYKLAFCDSRTLFKCQFASFKADLPVPPADSKFHDVFLPWSKFSDKWSSATGKHTAEHPPTAGSLRSITQLQIWTEGVEGDFHLQFRYVRASKAPKEDEAVFV